MNMEAKNTNKEVAIAGKYFWSIGIYTGENPLSLKSPTGIANPVLSAADIHDMSAKFVADPFMIPVNGAWYMFFEILRKSDRKGLIGCAKSDDGFSWEYQQVVLEENYHLSYPQVFAWADNYYMIPETLGAETVRLYRAKSFPDSWEHIADLLPGKYGDPSLFRHADRWWMFVCPNYKDNDVLELFHATKLEGPWLPHPLNPIISGDSQRARPGGRVLVRGTELIRFAQDCVPRYGTAVRAFRISNLSPTTYAEKEVAQGPVLQATGKGWNAFKMHHIDAWELGPNNWIACVDANDVPKVYP